jgi:hypothetical protein
VNLKKKKSHRESNFLEGLYGTSTKKFKMLLENTENSGNVIVNFTYNNFLVLV